MWHLTKKNCKDLVVCWFFLFIFINRWSWIWKLVNISVISRSDVLHIYNCMFVCEHLLSLLTWLMLCIFMRKSYNVFKSSSNELMLFSDIWDVTAGFGWLSKMWSKRFIPWLSLNKKLKKLQVLESPASLYTYRLLTRWPTWNLWIKSLGSRTSWQEHPFLSTVSKWSLWPFD